MTGFGTCQLYVKGILAHVIKGDHERDTRGVWR